LAEHTWKHIREESKKVEVKFFHTFHYKIFSL
jgi:hypothetical protein